VKRTGRTHPYGGRRSWRERSNLNAYMFGRDCRVRSGIIGWCSFSRRDELKIEARTEAQVYKPGDEARIRFRVTNSRGEGVQAALGLQVVDEAVFALAEKQPGFAKVFSTWSREVMKPRYEIHSFGMPDVVETSGVAQRDRAARALFAATEIVNHNRFETEAGRTVPMTKYSDYISPLSTQFKADVDGISGDLARAYRQHGNDLTKVDLPAFRDSWGNRVGIEQPNLVSAEQVSHAQRGSG